MRIHFQGFVEIDDDIDSHSDADWAVMQQIQHIADTSDNADEFYERLSLDYEVIPDALD